MGGVERKCNLLQLTVRLLGAEVDGRPNRDRAHLPRFLNGPEEDLVVVVGVGEQLVVVDLADERDLVRVAARH